MTKKEVNNLNLTQAMIILHRYNIKVKKFSTPESDIKAIARKVIKLEKQSWEHFDDDTMLAHDMREIWVKRALNHQTINL